LSLLRELVGSVRRWQESSTFKAGDKEYTVKASPAMAKQVWQRVIDEYPEFAELRGLLDLAELTWQRWGIGAPELARLDDTSRALLRVIVEGSG
jgi:hypothetical protein